MNEEVEYHIYRTVSGNVEGFVFEEDWKTFFLSLSDQLFFIDDSEYNFKYSDKGKLGISLEGLRIHIWFEIEKNSKSEAENIVSEFVRVLKLRFGNEVMWQIS